MSLEARCAELEAVVADLQRVIETQREQYDALIEAQAARIVELVSRVAELEARLRKDSQNSSQPPSRDGRDRRVRRAEERAARKNARAEADDGQARAPGKQPGAPGSTLTRRAPDATVVHAPDVCGGCGAGLDDAPIVGVVTRQVLDIPRPVLVATDHVAEKRRCACGCVTAGVFPPEATGPTCWGPRVKAVAVYLLIRQHIPLERAHEAMDVLFAAPVCEGTLAAWTLDAADRLAPFITELKALLLTAPVVCADETPVRCAGDGSFVHTISTDTLTLLAHHAKRGIEAIIAHGVLPDYRGVIMHDGLSVYDRTELANASHAQCHAHLDRHLIDVGIYHRHTAWTTAMRTVLHDTQAAARVAAAAGLEQVPPAIAEPLKLRYHHVITDAFAACPPGPPPRRRNRGGWFHRDRDAWNLATRFHTEADQILRLLDNTAVPATNNHAERALRMCKIHDKIAGTFRNPLHAQAFCTIRSYLQTGMKQGHDALTNLERLYTTTPWLPTG